jgi:hypothetical protein
VNLRLFPVDDPSHREAAELLPWFLNGTLDGLERSRVEGHLAECIACRQEAEDLRHLQAMAQREDPEAVVTRALSRLQARIDQLESGPLAARVLRATWRQWKTVPLWMQGALLAQFALLALLVAVLADRSPTQYYHTLSSPSAQASGRNELVVVFDSTRPEQEIRNLLLRLHARIVDGPSPEGAYTLDTATGDRSAVLVQLRQQPSVILAEPAPPR